MAQQIAVIDRAQTEIIEAAVEFEVKRAVELARIGLHERQQPLVDEAKFVTARDRLRERVDFLAGDFLGDVVRQQTRGEAAVFGLFGREHRRGADRQLVELLRGRTVVEAGNRARGHAHRIDGIQPVGGARHGAHDLVQIDRLALAVALGHGHRAGGMRRGQRELRRAGIGVRSAAASSGAGDVMFCWCSWCSLRCSGARLPSCPGNGKTKGRRRRGSGRGRSHAPSGVRSGGIRVTRRQGHKSRRLRWTRLPAETPGRYHAVCNARLPAGIRACGHGSGTSDPSTGTRFPAPAGQCS